MEKVVSLKKTTIIMPFNSINMMHFFGLPYQKWEEIEQVSPVR